MGSGAGAFLPALAPPTDWSEAEKVNAKGSRTMSPLMANVSTSARELIPLEYNEKPGVDIANCWTALAELRNCSNEIIGFFLNGQAEIDEPCCHAVDVIIHHCWPSMLNSLGYTSEEGNLLEGYCDKSSPGPAAAPSASATRA
ncbi:hypothetical protein Ancab_026766 [Ancistrocladus abbreviatus]